MAELNSHFTLLDYLVFCATFGISLFIGIFFAIKDKNKRTLDNYFSADRKSAVLPTALSLLVSYQSSIVVLGAPAEVYTYGLKFSYLAIPMALSFVFAGLTVVPVLHPLKLTSVYKYFQLRYHDNIIRYFAFGLGLIYYVFYMGAVIFGTCVALEFIIGIPYWATILLYTIVTTIYTSIGGMKAVIWTDVFQFIVMVIGVAAIIIKPAIVVGGIGNMVEIATSRLNMNDFRIDPRIRYQFWNTAIATFTAYLVSSLQQPSVQRTNCMQTLTEARRIYAVAGVLTGSFCFLISFEGVAIYAYYSSMGCDPLASGRIDNVNQLIPLAVIDLFSSLPGLSGLFIAALSSAALSTLSSSLSSLGAVTYDDIIRERYPDIPEHTATTYSKVVVLLYGLSALCVSFMLTAFPGSIANMFFAFMGCIDGPTCAIFMLSMFYKRATSKGLLIGALTGMAVVLWINIGQLLGYGNASPSLPSATVDTCLPVTNNTSTTMADHPNSTLVTTFQDTMAADKTYVQEIYSISFTCFSLIGFIITLIVAVLISLCTTPPRNVDEKYLFSFRNHIWQAFFSRQAENKSTSADEEYALHEGKDMELHDGENANLMNVVAREYE